MNIIFALILILIAGLMNGSFALPTKYIHKWSFENIWFQFSIWCFLIFPWAIGFIVSPHILQIYAASPPHLLITILIGGLFFGIGQMCFALALNLIGLGLGFVINLGLGIGLGFLLPLIFQYSDKIMTPFGLLTMAGTSISVVGLLLANYAGILRDREKAKAAVNLSTKKNNSNHQLGIIFAIISGISSAGQNFTLSLTHSLQPLAASMGSNTLGAANIIWPGFLLCAFIPYASYILYLHFKNRSFANYNKKGTTKYHFFAMFMALCAYGSMTIYSKASQLIGSIGPLIGWPIFLIVIIFTSSAWGWKYNEWENCGNKAKKTMLLSLGFLILSIAVLAYSSSLR